MDAVNAIRLVSIVMTAAIFWLAPSGEASTSLVYSIAFGHYILAVWYSRNRVVKIASQPAGYPPFLLVFLIGYLLYANKFSLVVYFAVHHAFNETYILNFLDGTRKSGQSRDMNYFRLSAAFFNIFIFLTTIRNHPDLSFLNPAFLAAGAAAASAPYFFFLNRLRGVLTPATMARACAFEIMALMILVVSFFVPVTSTQIVCYHVVSWIFLPLCKTTGGVRNKAWEYALSMGIVTAAAIMFSPIGIKHYTLEGSLFKKQFFFWSYLHITLSFAFSNAQPEWITRWFNPENGKRVSELAPQD